MQQSSPVPCIRPSVPIQIKLKSTSVCVKRPAAAQKMAEMKKKKIQFLIIGSHLVVKEQPKAAAESLHFQLFYGLTKTKHTKEQSLTFFFFLPKSTVPF